MRSSFGPSTLVRVLDPWTPVPADPSGADFAERMSGWLDAFDAIRLQGVHQSLRAGVPAKAATQRLAPQSLREDLQRVRSVVAHAIAQDPVAQAASGDEPEPGYAVYRQRHQDLQRQMTQMVGALRDHVRQSVARASPRLRQLAALDAGLEELLAAREQALLPTTLTLLERRFLQLRDTALQTFAAEWREALLAELDLRLEPVRGLIEAASTEPTSPP